MAEVEKKAEEEGGREELVKFKCIEILMMRSVARYLPAGYSLRASQEVHSN